MSIGPSQGVGADGKKGVLARSAALHTEMFGVEAGCVRGAPGRVNLIGEHTDYNGGFVLPIAIDRWAAVSASRRDDGRCRVVSEQYPGEAVECGIGGTGAEEAVRSLDPAWARCIAGAVLEATRLAAGRSRPPLGVSLAICSSLPVGGGVSSSAAVEMAVVSAVDQLLGLGLSEAGAVDACLRAERTYAGVPCGLMDPYVIANAEGGTAMLLDCRAGTHELIPVPRDEDAVGLLVDTRVNRALAGGEYAVRRAACQRAAAGLGLASLRDASEEMLLASRSRLCEDEFRAARHVVRENRRVLETARLLRQAAEEQIEDWEPVLEQIGVLLVQSHRSLRDDYQVSCAELECVVDAALEGDGVYGARLTGAGFGGCAFVLADPAWASRVARRIEERFDRQFDRRCGVSRIASVDGAWVRAGEQAQ